jgi:NAD-dependent SIR2 family protein deacetylase
MSENIQKKTAKHLMNIIKQRIGTVPNFALLLGAGCSCSSGVKSAKDMIIELRYKLYENLKIEKGYEEWLKENDWYNDEKEYQILFEKVYDERAQRRIYVEECIGSATPSWGYIYLANLIGNNYFNVIFTTNFDDLINEACFMYAGYKPIICAHDSSISDVRVTSARSKIIKLHGDFLYDNIKNTLKETETLETNTKEKLIQFGREYGLIVIGYGGNDDSIMDILNMMIKSKDFFPHGVYWCIRKNDKINKKVLNFLQKDRTYLIEIEGFDEFMAELALWT